MTIAITALECVLAAAALVGLITFCVIAAPVLLYEKAVRRPVQA